MNRNVKIISYDFNGDLQNKLKALVRHEDAKHYRIAATFCPPVTNGRIKVCVVLEKGGPGSHQDG